jgi:hypothetical protein
MPQLETFIFAQLILEIKLVFWTHTILFVYIIIPLFELLDPIKFKKPFTVVKIIKVKRPVKPDMSKYLKSLERFNDTF